MSRSMVLLSWARSAPPSCVRVLVLVPSLSHESGSTSASSRAMSLPVARDTRTTSSWSTAPPTAFVTLHSPSTRIPRACAGTVSGTTDIPTTSAPAVRKNRVSAGVS